VEIHRSFIALAALAGLYVIGSCSGDDAKKKALPMPDGSVQAGNGGGGSGGSASGGNAGSGGGPQAGASGAAPGGSSGAGGTGGEAGDGAGGESGNGASAGAGMGGEAGAGGGSCGVPSDTSCVTIVAEWNPRFDATTGEFRFDVSSLGAEIVSGFATYFSWTLDIDEGWLVDGCGQLDGTNFQVDGSDVVFTAGGPLVADRVTINALLLRDACGNEYSLRLNTGGACSWLQFLPAGAADEPWQAGCGSDGLTCSGQCV
jgi:hypothetical protein